MAIMPATMAGSGAAISQKKSFNRKINKVYQPQCRCFDITPTATKFLKLLTARFYRKPCFSRIFPYLSLQQSEFFGVLPAAGFDQRSSRTPRKSRLVGANA